MIDTNDTLGHIAATHPASTLVFLRHQLDFCCGGRQRMADACTGAGLDPAKIAEEIATEEATRSPERWDERPPAALIDFIVSHYHEGLRRDLPVLLQAAQKVERVHGQKASCPRGLASMLEQMLDELTQHMTKEEQMLFVAIRGGGRGNAVHMPIRVMMQEHDDHGESLRGIREIATGFVPPPEACATWRALYAGLEKLEAELMEHIHHENNVLFPRALNA